MTVDAPKNSCVGQRAELKQWPRSERKNKLHTHDETENVKKKKDMNFESIPKSHLLVTELIKNFKRKGEVPIA